MTLEIPTSNNDSKVNDTSADQYEPLVIMPVGFNSSGDGTYHKKQP